MTNDISSLDFIKYTIYKTKFSNWLSNNYLTSLLTEHSWKLKTVDSNLFFDLIDLNGFKFIKAKFNVGLIHIDNEDSIDEAIDKIMEYGEKPDLVAHLFSDTIKSNNIIFLQLTYEVNIYQGVDLEVLLNLIYDQIEMIKQDIKFILNLRVVNPRSFDEEIEDSEEEEEDDDDNNEEVIAPYDIRRQ